jgi:hypothetical protein
MKSWTNAEMISEYRVTVGGRTVKDAVQVQFISNDGMINGFQIPKDVAVRLGSALSFAADAQDRMTEIIGWRETEVL